jgi:hypothetical protein
MKYSPPFPSLSIKIPRFAVFAGYHFAEAFNFGIEDLKVVSLISLNMELMCC